MQPVSSDSFSDIPFPDLPCTIGSIRAMTVETLDEGTVRLEIQFPVPGYPHREAVLTSLRERLHQVRPDVQNVEIAESLNVIGPKSGGTVGLRVKNVIAVGSGKGGVGKSTVATSLALALQHLGASVGLLDADVYGPSIPHMTGSSGKPEVREHLNTDGSIIQRVHPVEHQGMKLMSIGYIVPEQEAVIWRGPMLHKMLTQFVSGTEWGELDYLIVDMPPGTGDVALTLSQMMSLAGAVVVCTPQKVALLDAIKAIGMYQKVNIPVLGMVENMTGEIFGRGGAAKAAAEQRIPFLGEIPITAEIRVCGDESRMQDLLAAGSPAREALLQVATETAMQAAKQFLSRPKQTSLEILQ
ncbi:MAG: P-loop NTPase [Planctomycetaceae bacterium]|nr:P-loop NTPase [Planctomycetaceae bacterium]